MQSTSTKTYDVIIIGGGINGCSIAADCAVRGLSVNLFEQYDLASGTSSYSSKLIHGGLRYLEQYDFRLVRHALAEREVWLKRAPHLIKPLQFVLPHQKHLRPKWLLRTGLWLYDHLSKRKSIAGSRGFQRNDNELLTQLVGDIQYGFSYYDCFCDDARLVIAAAQQAQAHGATIQPRHQVVKAELNDARTHWNAHVLDRNTMQTHTVHARALVNATGPWMTNVSQHTITPCHPYHSQLVKGSHIIVPKLYQGDHAYILQNADQRIVFVTPYQEHYSLVGTTDEVYHGKPEDACISKSETNYLISIINRYFKKPTAIADIVSHYSGIRPLLQQPGKQLKDISRDYEILIDNSNDHAPLITISGGKLTTARLLGTETGDKLKPLFRHMTDASTADIPLPGGDLGESLEKYTKTMQQQYPSLSTRLLQRLCSLYGSNVTNLLGEHQVESDLGQCFGSDCYQCEVDYLMDSEWAIHAEDILWRRTKLGLTFTREQTQHLQTYMESRHAPATDR